MTTIAILPELPEASSSQYRAVAGPFQSVGRTVGEALDALTAQLAPPEGTTLVVVQWQRPDRYFSAEQQQRLRELMARWRAARDTQTPFPPVEQAELETLMQEEVRAATRRAEDLLRGTGA